MSLHVTSEVTEDAVIQLLSQFFPATIDLDPLGSDPGRRWIRIERPSHFDFVPTVGIRVRTSATLQWTALGIAVPATLTQVDLLLQPVIVEDERGPKMLFCPSLEHADFRLLPAIVDKAIADRINTALRAEADLIGWHFGESLAQRVPMPPNITPVDALHLSAGAMRIEVKERSLVIAIEMKMSFTRQRPDQAKPATT